MQQLEREAEHKLIGGVLAGLAQYFNQDPVLFRIIAIVLLILTGIFPGVLLYVIAWIIMPLKRADYTVYEQ